MKAAVMISDGRMQVIAARLEELGMDVMRATDTASMQAVEEAAPTLDFLLLPIRGVDGAGMVHIPGVDYSAGTMLERLKPEAVLLTGLHTDYLHALDRPVFCYYDDAQVREENTALTAEGLLYYFMQVTPKSIYEYTVDIIGYGHVGRKTAELFERIGIAVRVVTDEAPEEGGIPMIAYDHWKNGKPCSVIINTAPSTVITKTMAEHFQPGTIIIDIASNQVGVEPAVYEMPHICVKAAPGLPGLVAEQSAGEILADYIERNFLKKTGF